MSFFQPLSSLAAVFRDAFREGHATKRRVMRHYRPQLEQLETKTPLAGDVIPATAAVFAPDPAAAPIERQDPIVIQAVHFNINGQAVTLTQRNGVIQFDPGDQFEVVGVDYQVSTAGSSLDGVVAFEGYLRHTSPGSMPGKFDYADGRFGDPASMAPLTEGTFVHTGLSGGWELPETANRLSLVLVRYDADGWTAEDRFFANLQSFRPDLTLDKVAVKNGKVGKAIGFSAELKNLGNGLVPTYSEVDVYSARDLTTPIWVGVFEASLDGGQKAHEKYTNTNPHDDYDAYFVPAATGLYFAKFYADPEDALSETDELNNERLVRFFVKK